MAITRSKASGRVLSVVNEEWLAQPHTTIEYLKAMYDVMLMSQEYGTTLYDKHVFQLLEAVKTRLDGWEVIEAKIKAVEGKVMEVLEKSNA